MMSRIWPMIGVLVSQAEGPASMTPGGVIGLFTSLGASAAAVIVAYLFLQFFTKYLNDEAARRNEFFKSLYDQINDLAKDKAEVIKDNTAAMRELVSASNRQSSLISDMVGRIEEDRAILRGLAVMMDVPSGRKAQPERGDKDKTT